jgi:uncharacterized protein YjbI with pentapeptide repeats
MHDIFRLAHFFIGCSLLFGTEAFRYSSRIVHDRTARTDSARGHGDDGYFSRWAQDWVKSSTPKDFAFKHLLMDNVAVPKLDVGEAKLKDVEFDKLAAKRAELSEADLSHITLKDVGAHGVDVQGMKASSISIQDALASGLTVSDVGAKDVSMQNVALSSMNLTQADVSNIDMSHVSTDDMKLHGLDLKGSADMKSVQLSKVVLGDVEVGPVKNIGQELHWFLMATKAIAVFVFFITCLTCNHLVFVILKDIKAYFKDDGEKEPNRVLKDEANGDH